MTHIHTHHHHEKQYKKGKFLSVIFLNLLISLIEIVAGIISGSMALISDAFHNLEDTASLVISYIAWVFSFKSPDFKRTYGYKRVEVVAAFVNSLFLIGVCVFIIFEAGKRFLNPEKINSDMMILVSFFAFLINISSAFIIHKEGENNINWKASYLHLMGDAGFSLAVLLGAFFIKRFDYYFIDPSLSIIMSVFIIFQSVSVFIKSFNILIQSGPDIDYEKIKKNIEDIDGVINVHHIHTWLGNEKTVYFEAHVEIKDCLVSESCLIHDRIEELLSKDYGIKHITLQFETDRCREKDIIHRVR